MKISGIYIIQSISHPERVYVGSAKDIYKRWQDHRYQLKTKKHHSLQFQRHFDKYGVVDLEFSVLMECDKNQMRRREEILIKLFNPYFNARKDCGDNTGWHHSLESRRKMSEKLRGRKPPELSQESRDAISQKLTGHPVSTETREKLRNAGLGKKQSNETIEKRVGKLKGKKYPNRPPMKQETKDKISRANKGRNISKETREKISLANKGTNHRDGHEVTEATREKLRQAQTGRKYSEESKRKMRDSHLGKPNPMKGRKTGKPAWNRGLKKKAIEHVGS